MCEREIHFLQKSFLSTKEEITISSLQICKPGKEVGLMWLQGLTDSSVMRFHSIKRQKEITWLVLQPQETHYTQSSPAAKHLGLPKES